MNLREWNLTFKQFLNSLPSNEIPVVDTRTVEVVGFIVE